MTKVGLQRLSEPRERKDGVAIGETDSRLETVDGWVLPSPAPTVPHQSVAHLLVRALRTSARKAGLGAHGAVLLRLGPDRLLVPDLVVARADRLAAFADATDTVLVGEITRPGSDYAGTPERIEHYAAAGIPWLLLTQPESAEHRAVTVRLFHLQDERYLERASAGPGDILISKVPFPLRIRTADLVVF
ncbi:Uma2 family endonuclease [Actinoplanes sp. M2I2]|uniref:Uma2 family endonuclease n=1 Tax=Actinoplanes sp. M2I2 TaxID=1734444 RepID=UPI002020F6C5|nr:Uma2 family endonuclease [Actinoplanes sp. M2I2]